MTWKIEEVLQRTGVLKEGHFLLSSGRHSRQYMQCAQLLQYPWEAERVGKALADQFRDIKVDVVIGPALGGVIIAHEVARALGVRCLFTERKDGKMELRRGFEIKPEENILIIEDVVTTGGSVKEVIQVVDSFGANLVGVGSIIDRSGGKNPFPCLYRSLIQVNIETYLPNECPLCQQGSPLIKPGSRKGLFA